MKIFITGSTGFIGSQVVLSNIFKFPPPMGMSVDQMRVMKERFSVDGSKAERELGLTYTPIRAAIEEEIAAEKQ